MAHGDIYRSLSTREEILALHDRRAEIDKYFLSLNSYPTSSAKLETSSTPIEKKAGGKDESGRPLVCTTSEYTLTSNPNEIVLYSPDAEVLWLGALVQGKNLSGIGSFQELPIIKRAPLEVSIDISAPDNTATVVNPSAATMRKSIGGMIFKLSTDKAKYSSSVSFKLCETYSLEQSLLEVGLSAHYSGAEFQAKHSEVTTQEKHVMSVSYIEKCFTAVINSPPTPSSLFSSDFSMDDIRAQERVSHIGAKNAPVLLSTITYGRMFYCTISSKKSFSDLRTSLNASFQAAGAGGSASVTEGQKQLLEECTFTVSAIGVPQDAIAKLICTGKVSDFFAMPMDIATAAPISYIFRNIVDLSIASYVNSGSYKMTVCVPLDVNADVSSHLTDADKHYANFAGCVEAAAANINDLPTRADRTRGYQDAFTLTIFALEWLLLNLHKAPYTNDDRSYCKEWLTKWNDKLSEKNALFQSEFNNQPLNRGIYQDGMYYSSRLIDCTQAILRST